MDIIKVKGKTWKAEILQFFGIMGIESSTTYVLVH